MSSYISTYLDTFAYENFNFFFLFFRIRLMKNIRLCFCFFYSVECQSLQNFNVLWTKSCASDVFCCVDKVYNSLTLTQDIQTSHDTHVFMDEFGGPRQSARFREQCIQNDLRKHVASSAELQNLRLATADVQNVNIHIEITRTTWFWLPGDKRGITTNNMFCAVGSINNDVLSLMVGIRTWKMFRHTSIFTMRSRTHIGWSLCRRSNTSWCSTVSCTEWRPFVMMKENRWHTVSINRRSVKIRTCEVSVWRIRNDLDVISRDEKYVRVRNDFWSLLRSFLFRRDLGDIGSDLWYDTL